MKGRPVGGGASLGSRDDAGVCVSTAGNLCGGVCGGGCAVAGCCDSLFRGPVQEPRSALRQDAVRRL